MSEQLLITHCAICKVTLPADAAALYGKHFHEIHFPCMSNACEHGRQARKCEICELNAMEKRLTECEDVLRQVADPGWLSDAISAGGVEGIAREVCRIKRQARGVLATGGLV